MNTNEEVQWQQARVFGRSKMEEVKNSPPLPYTEWLKILNEFVNKLPKTITKVEAAWIEALQIYIYLFLQPLIKNDELRMRYISEGFAYFRNCFTHEAFDPDRNYESFELKGDKLLGSCFVNYLSRKYTATRVDGVRIELLDAADLSNLINYYQNREIQSSLTKKFGFESLIRLDPIPNATVKILGDVYEAIFGAVYSATESLTKVAGSGYIVTNQMVEFIYASEIRDDDIQRERYGAQETQLKEMFERMGWGEFKVFTKDSQNETSHSTIRTPDGMIDWFKNNRPTSSIARRNPKDLLGEGRGVDKAESKRRAIEMAFRIVLEGIRVDDESYRDPIDFAVKTRKYTSPSKWARDLFKIKADAEIKDDLERARVKARNQGYNDLEFQTRDLDVTADKSHTMIDLVAIKDGQITKLASEVVLRRPKQFNTTKLKMINTYLAK